MVKKNKKEKAGYLSKNKKAQGVFGLSFSVIFSIFLIIFFIIIAFLVIRSFLGTQKCAQVAIFAEDFQNEVKKAWNSPLQISTFKGRLPSNLDYVCFANFSRNKNLVGEYKEIGEDLSIYEGRNANLFLYPIENTCDLPYHNIKYLDLANIISEKNPYCIEVDGNVDIKIQKELGARYVCVGDDCE
jgi:hypothetical protein